MTAYTADALAALTPDTLTGAHLAHAITLSSFVADDGDAVVRRVCRAEAQELVEAGLADYRIRPGRQGTRSSSLVYELVATHAGRALLLIAAGTTHYKRFSLAAPTRAQNDLGGALCDLRLQERERKIAQGGASRARDAYLQRLQNMTPAERKARAERRAAERQAALQARVAAERQAAQKRTRRELDELAAQDGYRCGVKVAGQRLTRRQRQRLVDGMLRRFLTGGRVMRHTARQEARHNVDAAGELADIWRAAFGDAVAELQAA